MIIYINNRIAALKQGSSFEFVSENRMFSGSDGYTLTITFPLKGCLENIAIFGHINRSDVTAQKAVFDCEIRCKSFSKFGTIVITEISETEVKTQFLEGRSEQNFDKTFENVYINELDLGEPSVTNPASITPEYAWFPHTNGVMESVAMPWVNNNSDSGLPHNFADYNAETDRYSWSSTTKRLTWMPYLLFITKQICHAVGYSYDFTQWENDEHFKYLLVCNVLPDAWEVTPYARALPHWSVDEYFEKLELFLGGEFTIDHRGKRITFAFTNDVLDAVPTVRLDNVVDEYTTEVKIEDEQCEYLEAVNLVYKSQDNSMWKYYSCDWYIKLAKGYVTTTRFNTLTELLNATKQYQCWSGRVGRGCNYDHLFYAADYDRYYCVRPLYKKNGMLYCTLQSVNTFGGRIVNESEDADENEIEFIPAWIDQTEDKYGECLFLDIGSYNETQNGYGSREYAESIDRDELTTNLITRLMAGESEQKAEYFDVIYIGYWGGINYDRGHLPHPYVDDFILKSDWSKFIRIPFSLRLNDKLSTRRAVHHHINPKQKTTFKFLSDTIPNVRAVFLIRGKRYICEKLTATFTAEAGMSQLIKGTFYPIED